MTKKKDRRKWNFSILHNGEQGVGNLFAIFAIAAIIAIPIIHFIFHFPVLACIIISFVVFWSIPTMISVILGFAGAFTKSDEER